jgi:hypothetical protein
MTPTKFQSGWTPAMLTNAEDKDLDKSEHGESAPSRPAKIEAGAEAKNSIAFEQMKQRAEDLSKSKGTMSEQEYEIKVEHFFDVLDRRFITGHEMDQEEYDAIYKMVK